MKKLVIVAPTFNEQENIESFITNVIAQQTLIPNFNLQILISDSHSKDKTGEIVKKIQKREKKVFLLDTKVPGPGKLGAGLSEGLDYGVNRLSADLLITMEADLTNDVNKIPEFVEKLSKADIVVGSRYIKGGGVVNWSWWRKTLSYFANLILRCFSGATKLHEFTNLYRGFKKEVWIEIGPRVRIHTGWLFVPAFIFEATTTKFKIVEIPYTFYDRFGGRSKMNTVNYTKNLLNYALRFRLQKLWHIF